MAEAILFATAFFASFVGVEVFRRWSLRRGLLDVPNHRSSHDSPIPRGGGSVIVGVSLLLYAFISLYITHNFKWHFVIASSIVAVISWLDDLYSISFAIRLVFQSAAAAILVGGLGFWGEIAIPGSVSTIGLGWFGAIAAFLWLVWMTNAYNFMDGIDGIAGAQAVSAGVAWFVFGYLFNFATISMFGGVLAFAALGFLIHNWSPAKVFMGDVGSAFLGFTFAAMPFLGDGNKTAKTSYLLVAGVLFVWFFLFDTVYTLCRRALRKEKVWNPHREHLYQRRVIAGSSHSSIALIFACFAAIVAASGILAICFRGIFWAVLLFITVMLSCLLLFWAAQKEIDLNIEK